ncbi:MAG: glycosyltransferase [Pseudomonadota bacterium]
MSGQVCFVLPVTDDLPTRERELAKLVNRSSTLVSYGFDITVLRLPNDSGAFSSGMNTLRDRLAPSVRIVDLPEPKIGNPNSPKPMYRAYKVYEWLKLEVFDTVYFSLAGGAAFYCTIAKFQGLAFSDTVLCVDGDFPTLWAHQANQEIIQSPDHFLTLFLEKSCVEMADRVLVTGSQLWDWMHKEEWAVEASRRVYFPYFGNEIGSPSDHPDFGIGNIRHRVQALCYCGTLDFRHGVQLFCNAIKRLSDKIPSDTLILFALSDGSQKEDAGLDYIKRQAKLWPYPVRLLSDKTDYEIAEELAGLAAAAVFPSSAHHFPDLIFRLWEKNVPVLASEHSGYKDYFQDEDVQSVLLSERPQEMADQLERTLDQGVPDLLPRSNLANWRKDWINFNSEIVPVNTNHQPDTSALPDCAGGSEASEITVCLVHYERPHFLDQAIESLENQTFQNFTVHVIDDGSQSAQTVAYLDQLESRLGERGWKLFRQKNSYLGAARNTGARTAKSKYLFFMDDDNIAKPNELEVFYGAAEKTEADVLTCFGDVFVGEHLPKNRQPSLRRIYCGANLSGGMWSNIFGDSNSLVRRKTFESLGGFHEEFGAGQEDQEFFARVILAGHKLMVVPEALYWYRISDVRLRNNHFSMNRGGMKVFEAYLANVPAHLRDLVRQGYALGYRAPQAQMTHKLDLNPGVTGIAFKVYNFQKKLFDTFVGFQRKAIDFEKYIFARMIKVQAAGVVWVISFLRKFSK